jgi:hypothetical protein
MAVTLPHIEDLNRTTYLPPKGDYEIFVDESHYAEKVKEWGLSSAKDVKKQFWYKEKDHQRLVAIKGYQVYGESTEYYTLVIEFQDGNLSCIHPAYLKEMQASSFGKALPADTVDKSPAPANPETKQVSQTAGPEAKASAKESPVKKEKKDKPPKLDLPEEKVHFTATVKQFGLTWNNFNEENDEVVVLENVVIQQEFPIEVGLCWCAHSKTLKKFELVPGTVLEFDGKIVKKKLPKGKDIEEEEMVVEEPVLYKINNPSKIKKS